MKKRPIVKTILTIFCDLLATGILLCVFAVFHHVIRTPGGTGDAIEIVRPSPDAVPATSSPGVDRTETPVQTENSYQSGAISVTLHTIQSGSGSSAVTYHVADINVENIEALRTAFANETYGRNYAQSVLEQDLANHAILAISGDSYGLSGGGIVIRNGILYQYKETDSDICVLYYDGTMETLSAGEYSKESLIEKGAYQVWSFGPGLLDKSGNAKTTFHTSSYLLKKHPRCAIGYYEPGHYAFVLVDGRQKASQGLTLEELALLFEKLGCIAAYNLDGGKSTVMTFNDKIYNDPYTEPRDVSDIIYIGEV
jgi:hypothetical protein